ncbi:MAG: hypothetical protein KDC37_03065 [Flavobacteriales bacterium]|nr:hypothetical protein [Flavobacteriales bacterium]
MEITAKSGDFKGIYLIHEQMLSAFSGIPETSFLGLIIEKVDGTSCLKVGNLKPEYVLVRATLKEDIPAVIRAHSKQKMAYSDSVVRYLVQNAVFKYSPEDYLLTRKQIEAAIAYVIHGSYKKAAIHLGVSCPTVLGHVSEVRDKLGVKTLAQMTYVFVKNDWLKEGCMCPPPDENRLNEPQYSC